MITLIDKNPFSVYFSIYLYTHYKIYNIITKCYTASTINSSFIVKALCLFAGLPCIANKITDNTEKLHFGYII